MSPWFPQHALELAVVGGWAGLVAFLGAWFARDALERRRLRAPSIRYRRAMGALERLTPRGRRR